MQRTVRIMPQNVEARTPIQRTVITEPATKKKHTLRTSLIVLAAIVLTMTGAGASLLLPGHVKGALTTINNEYRESVTKTDNNKLSSYYNLIEEKQYGAANLEKLLSQRQWKTAYKEDVFDCSNMSAALEWTLENGGFHTIIVVGNLPWGDTGKHAWLLVEVDSGQYIPVESTKLSIVHGTDPYFRNYFNYDRTFETIEEALAYNRTEFSW